MGLEPTTSSLGSWHSTAELRPLLPDWQILPAEKAPLVLAEFLNGLEFNHRLINVALCINIIGIFF